MAIHLLKLIDRQTVANHTVEFRFEKPASFHFKPGQYGGFTLINPPEIDKNGITRRFSLLSTPDDPHLAIAVRIQHSIYKRILNTLPIGSEIKFAGPTGHFTLHEDKTVPAIFLAGGIGITPFYSMIRDAIQRQSMQSLCLFYGNQTTQDSAYLNELIDLQNRYRTFHFIPTLVTPPIDWKGETGFITDTMIKKYIHHLSNPIYYICGSPAMVTTLQEMLAEMGIDEERIKVEDFPGY